MQLFLKHGYSNVSLEQIVKKVGMTRGAFYWHFSTKEEILQEILNTYRFKIERLLVDQFNRDQDQTPSRVKEIVYSIVENFYEKQEFKDFIELTWFKLEQDHQDSALKYKVLANDYFIAELKGIIDKGQKLGHINPAVSARVLAFHATALINGIYRMYFICPKFKKADAKSIVDNFCAMLEI